MRSVTPGRNYVNVVAQAQRAGIQANRQADHVGFNLGREKSRLEVGRKHQGISRMPVGLVSGGGEPVFATMPLHGEFGDRGEQVDRAFQRPPTELQAKPGAVLGGKLKRHLQRNLASFAAGSFVGGAELVQGFRQGEVVEFLGGQEEIAPLLRPMGGTGTGRRAIRRSAFERRCRSVRLRGTLPAIGRPAELAAHQFGNRPVDHRETRDGQQ